MGIKTPFGFGMRYWTYIVGLLAALMSTAVLSAAEPDRATVLVVVGAPGEASYGERFAKWADYWKEATINAGAALITVGLDADTGKDKEMLQQKLTAEPKEGANELWLVLLGHGTFDGKEAKFNLRGADITVDELAEWLKPFKRPVAVIDTSSSSGAFLPKLSQPGRIVVTATKSGFEQNFARFGEYFSKAVVDTSADLDKDGQTSLLEAYLSASRKVVEFYETEGRLSTEHALLDDNGDALGTPADWFRGVRAVKKAKDGAESDGFRAHQFHLLRSPDEQKMPAATRAKRDELELALNRLREKKATIPPPEYNKELERLLLELAQLYKAAGLLKAD